MLADSADLAIEQDALLRLERVPGPIDIGNPGAPDCWSIEELRVTFASSEAPWSRNDSAGIPSKVALPQ
jgi:hypothetical protein